MLKAAPLLPGVGHHQSHVRQDAPNLDASQAAGGVRGAKAVFLYGRQFPFDPLVVQDVHKSVLQVILILLHLQDGGGLSTGASFSTVVICDPFSSFQMFPLMLQTCDSVFGWMINRTRYLIHRESQMFFFSFPLQFALSLYYLAMVGHTLSIASLIICLIIFSYFK